MVAIFSFFVVFALAVLPGGNTAAVRRETPTPQDQMDQYLSCHNSVREKHGAAPLQYSQDLAEKAQEWASRCKFQHSRGALGPYGENLAAGGSTDPDYVFSISDAIGLWAAEARSYDPKNPRPSHFTQMVWKATTEIGCAFQTQCEGIFPRMNATFYVCEYYPPGNDGRYSENVQP